MSDFVTSRGLPTSVLFAVCLAVVGLPVAEADPLRKGYLLQYQEEFNEEALNTEDWYYRDMNTERLGGYNKKEAVSVVTEDGIGMLKIAYYEADMDGDTSPDPVGGGIISRTTFGYGYYEARIKFYDGARGLHQSFWTAGTGNWSTYDWQVNEDARNDLIPWNNSALEIDGIELDSNYNHGSANYHWWLPEHSNPANAHKSFSATYIDKTDWITCPKETIASLPGSNPPAA